MAPHNCAYPLCDFTFDDASPTALVDYTNHAYSHDKSTAYIPPKQQVSEARIEIRPILKETLR